MKFHYTTNCTAARGDHIEAMIGDAREITFQTFRRRCDVTPWAQLLGYAVGKKCGLRLAHDWHVRYYRSRYRSRRCYFAVQSAIEWVFLP